MQTPRSRRGFNRHADGWSTYTKQFASGRRPPAMADLSIAGGGAELDGEFGRGGVRAKHDGLMHAGCGTELDGEFGCSGVRAELDGLVRAGVGRSGRRKKADAWGGLPG